jgi:hypothetical protein
MLPLYFIALFLRLMSVKNSALATLLQGADQRVVVNDLFIAITIQSWNIDSHLKHDVAR